MLRTITLACAVVVAAAAGTALGQQAGWSPGPLPVEFSAIEDLEVIAPGGPLNMSAGQVLYTEVVDGAGDLQPSNATLFNPEQVDALANCQDAYFDKIVNNDPAYDLAVSFYWDPLRPPPNPDDDRWAVYNETSTGVCSPEISHLGLYFPSPIPSSAIIHDVDGLELWGGSSHDAKYYSLQGDYSRGTSVFIWTLVGAVDYIFHPDIVIAVSSSSLAPFSYIGPPDAVDVDALMVYDRDADNEWNVGDEILFSIHPAGNWHGGEIVRLENTSGGLVATFPDHGGHLWDPTFDPKASFPLITYKDVDGIEAWLSGGNWDNPDLTNYCGVWAHGVAVVLVGTQTVFHHYDGYPGGLRFRGFSVTDAGGDTLLRWWDLRDGGDNLVAGDGSETVHVGWRTRFPDQVRHMYWTDSSGGPIGDIFIAKPTKPVLGSDGRWHFNWPNPYVPTPPPLPGPIRICGVGYAVFDQPLFLEELNAQNTELAEALTPVSGGEEIVVPPGDEVDMALPAAIPPGKALVLRYNVTAEGGCTEVQDFHQVLLVQEELIPAVGEWGLLVLALLLLTAAKVVSMRHRQAGT